MDWEGIGILAAGVLLAVFVILPALDALLKVFGVQPKPFTVG